MDAESELIKLKD